MEQEKKSSRKLISRIILGVVVLIGSWYAYVRIKEAANFETTDDAQIEGDISAVTSRIPGYIDKVFIEDNMSVNKGDTLIILDGRDLKIRLDQAQAALENAQANYEVALANASSVKTNSAAPVYRIDELKIRLANAEKEYERYKKLLADGVTTQQHFDKVEADRDALKTQLEAAEQNQLESNSRVVTANEQIKVAESILHQRQVDLDAAKLNYSYAVITAPFSGTVSKKNAVPGQFIQAGQPMCSLIGNSDVWVVANFKETQVGAMKEGMEVEVEVDAFPGEKFKGNIASFSSATGARFSLIPPDNATGNFVKVVQRIPVKIELDHTHPLYQRLKPGMSVYLKVNLKSA